MHRNTLSRFRSIIPVVINMFRLPNGLTGDHLRCKRLRHCKRDNRYIVYFSKNICPAQPQGGQVVCCAGPKRVSCTGFWLCCTGLIHRDCAGNDLTDRGFGNDLWNTTLLGNELPLSERYSDKRYSRRYQRKQLILFNSTCVSILLFGKRIYVKLI